MTGGGEVSLGAGAGAIGEGVGRIITRSKVAKRFAVGDRHICYA